MPSLASTSMRLKLSAVFFFFFFRMVGKRRFDCHESKCIGIFIKKKKKNVGFVLLTQCRQSYPVDYFCIKLKILFHDTAFVKWLIHSVEHTSVLSWCRVVKSVGGLQFA